MFRSHLPGTKGFMSTCESNDIHTIENCNVKANRMLERRKVPLGGSNVSKHSLFLRSLEPMLTRS